MKRIYRLFSFVLVLVLVFALAIGLTGCGTKTQEAKPKEGAAEEKPSEGAGEASKEPFKVALLTPGSISDAGWNASAYEGLKAIEQELGATISNLETKAPAEFEEGLRSYASQGFDLIFAHGFEYQDAAKKIADQFPDTVFVITSGTDPYGKNVSPLIFLEEEGYYIMGLAAAKLTKSNKIGLIGGMEIPSLVYPYTGFHLGVTDNNPNAEVSTTWLGTWEDVGKAKEAALALIDSGCDVVFGSADQATLGILQACREKGVWTFGAYGSQIPLAPEVVVGELLLDMKSAFVEVAKEVQGKTFKGGIIALGLKDKAVTFNWNDGLADKIPAEVRQAGEQAAADIESGKKQIPKYSLGEE